MQGVIARGGVTAGGIRCSEGDPPVASAAGQAISTRILPDEGQGPRMEVTDQEVGTLCGVNTTTTVTYVGTMRPNGTIAGTGTGIVMTADGGSATFRATGVGRFVRPGVVSW